MQDWNAHAGCGVAPRALRLGHAAPTPRALPTCAALRLRFSAAQVRFSKQEASQRTMAYRDIAADIEKLRARAAMRMRDFLLQKIGAPFG